jgi:isopentenyl-diphosphate delta-isomerase
LLFVVKWHDHKDPQTNFGSKQRVENVILVDEDDRETGTCEKMEAHRKGLLHRAFSVFIFNSRGEMLLQKRAKEKYHSGGLWTNACCSHPRPGEDTLVAAERRLREELGFTTALHKKDKFVYEVKLDKGLTEHEFDHVFTGIYDGEIRLNLEEAEEYKWLTLENIKSQLEMHPQQFTYWFRMAVGKFF